MSTVSQGTDSSVAVAAAGSQALERPAGLARPAPVESTIKPTAFVALTITILVILAASVVAIWAGGSFDGGQPGFTAPANR